VMGECTGDGGSKGKEGSLVQCCLLRTHQTILGQSYLHACPRICPDILDHPRTVLQTIFELSYLHACSWIVQLLSCLHVPGCLSQDGPDTSDHPRTVLHNYGPDLSDHPTKHACPTLQNNYVLNRQYPEDLK
jgi:hypothetical protein